MSTISWRLQLKNGNYTFKMKTSKMIKKVKQKEKKPGERKELLRRKSRSESRRLRQASKSIGTCQQQRKDQALTSPCRKAYSCPDGRGAQKDKPVSLLPSHLTKRTIYELYCDAFNALPDAERPAPAGPLTFSAFLRVWKRRVAYLRVARREEDYCDTCYRLLSSSVDGVLDLFKQHLEKATLERRVYQLVRGIALTPNPPYVHVAFDFAEKILLPYLSRSPGQLYFTTGLKVDLFGISVSNLHKQFNVALVEGHWPSVKGADAVTSMLHTVLQDRVTSREQPLQLHADNCSGQNKNAVLIWYLAWRVIVGLSPAITYRFMLPGHAKNHVDAGFGNIRRKLKTSDVAVPAALLQLIDGVESSECMSGTDITWLCWKRLLGRYFVDLPSKTRYRIFRFDARSPGSVFVRQDSRDPEEREFKLLMVPPTVITTNYAADLSCSDYSMPNMPLDKIVPRNTTQSRRDILEKTIADKFYPGNEAFANAFFASGADWRAAANLSFSIPVLNTFVHRRETETRFRAADLFTAEELAQFSTTGLVVEGNSAIYTAMRSIVEQSAAVETALRTDPLLASALLPASSQGTQNH
eukprot:m.147905 g.147905  ORF g.147905 m.147905 type:complete len:583 (+) comp16122_c0_seq2:206-1954(+)